MFGDNVFKSGKSDSDSKLEKDKAYKSDPPVEVKINKSPEVTPAPVSSSLFQFDSEGGVDSFVSACKSLTKRQIDCGETVTLDGCPVSEIDIIGSSFRGEHYKPIYINGGLRYPR